MGSFLEQFNDPGLQVDMLWTPEQEVRKQIARLKAQAAMAGYALEVPRRLQGPEQASALALAEDKRISRKLQGRCNGFAAQWEDDADADDFLETTNNHDELKALGAQVHWPDWWADNKTHLQAELRRIATHALKTGHIKTGNRFCNRIVNELAQIEQIVNPQRPN